MRGGFSFCGVDIADLGLEYAPEGEDMHVHRAGEWDKHEETFDSHHGGYHYGTTVKPKVFTLRCYFEGKHPGMVSRIDSLFRRGRSGKLVFQHKPWIYYIATVTAQPNMSDHMNLYAGIITFELTAYYPFGRGDDFWLNPGEIYYNQKMFESAMLPFAAMLPSRSLSIKDKKEQSLLLFNPGTEMASVAIEVEGTCNNVTIYNKNTKETCGLVNVNTDTGSYLSCDELTGKVTIGTSNSRQMAFVYHNKGFLRLEPAYPIHRQVVVSYENGDQYLTTPKVFNESLTGQYVWADGIWHQIISTDKTKLFIKETMTKTSTEMSAVVRMNEIFIQSDETMNISRLEFKYQPTYT